MIITFHGETKNGVQIVTKSGICTREFPITESHRVKKISDSFNWGYVGSGPLQLSLALLLDRMDKKYAISGYAAFCQDCVCHMGISWELAEQEIQGWIEGKLDAEYFLEKWNRNARRGVE